MALAGTLAPGRRAGRGLTTSDFEVVRDPLWDNIRLDQAALAVLDTAPVQRLRYVRQLGHAFLVYPGATHTRFEHALGAYHLTRLALASLEERGELSEVTERDRMALRLAALLHDIGHYPFSHTLEEAGFPSHEQLGVMRLVEGELGALLEKLGGTGFARYVGALIVGGSTSPVVGLISGSLDLDKIDYLSRDAHMCGVPYGTVDVDRLLASLTLVRTPANRLEVGVHEKGVSALESMLFAKYQMYRNVYWHHAVRSATCMFKRAVRQAVAAGALKRAMELPASDVPASAREWVSDEPAVVERVEDAVAREVGLAPGELLIDYPSRQNMLSVDLPLRMRDGRIERLTDQGRAGQLGLPAIAGQLYRSARRFRVFVARPITADLRSLLDVITRPAVELKKSLDAGERLL